MYSRSLGRSLLSAALVVAGCSIVPAAANASIASMSGDQLTYSAAPGEVNDVAVSKWDGAFTVVEKKVKITPGAGCSKISSKSVKCTGATLTSTVTFTLDDKNDFLRLVSSGPYLDDDYATSNISAGDGNDLIRGGAAADTIMGGNGDDYLTDGAGDDFMYGESGSDTIDSVHGNDLLDGGADTDVLRSWRGADTIIQ